MRIFVAGGAGYIGSKLVPALLERGYDVAVADLFWFGNNLPTQIKIIKKDLFDITKGELVGFDQLIFLAGLSNDPMAEFSPAKNFIYNAALPAYLAFIAKQAGVKRYVYGSSCSVYGYAADKLYDEKSPVVCSYPYGISKLQGEDGVFQLQDENFSVISLRQGTVGGHSPRMRFDLVVNTMFKCIQQDGGIVVNNPSIWRPILDIRDAVTAYLRSVQASPSISGSFNVASGNYTIGQVGDLIKESMEKHTGKKVNMQIKNIEDFRNYKVSCEKAKTSLGFEPKHDVPSTIDSIMENYSAYGDLNQDKYYNIKVFKKLKRVGL